MADVFISYSREDSDFVETIHDALVKRNRDVWVDWEDILFTANWWREITDGIEAANTFVFVISPDSLSSVVCNFEVFHAVEHNKRIVPIVFRKASEDAAIEQLKSKESRLSEVESEILGNRKLLDIARTSMGALSRHNWVPFDKTKDFDATFDQFLEALDTDINHTKLHTRLLVRTLEWNRIERNPGFLLTGDEITSAEDWLQSAEARGKKPAPTELQRDYIKESRKQEDSRRRLLRNLRLASIVAAVIGIIAVIATVFSLLTANNASNREATATIAQGQAQQAVIEANSTLTQIPATVQAIETQVRSAEQIVSSLNLVARADSLFDDAPSLALSLAVAANQIENPPAQSRRILTNIGLAPGAIGLYEGHSNQVYTVAISPDNTMLASGSEPSSHTVLVHDIASSELLYRFEDFRNAINGLRFTEDNRYLVVTSASAAEIVVLDMESGEEISRSYGIGEGSSTVAISPDGTLVLAAGYNDTEIALWDVSTGTVIRRFPPHRDKVTAIAFSADGEQFISASCAVADSEGACPNAEILVRNISNGGVIRRFNADIGGTPGAIAISPDERFVLSDGQVGEVILWNVSSGAIEYRVSAHTDFVRGLAFSPDGYYFASIGDDGFITLRDIASGALQQRFDAHHALMWGLSFSPDGTLLATASWDHTAIVWNLQDDNYIARRFPAHSSIITAVAYSPDGAYMASGVPGEIIIVWDARSGEMIHTLEGHSDTILDLAFSPDSRTLLSGSSDKTVILWNLADGSMLQQFGDHGYSVYAVDFSPDGERFVSGSCSSEYPCEDGEIFLRDISSGRIIQRFTGHSSFVYDLQFSPDGTKLLSGSWDNSAILWDVASGEILYQMEDHDDTVYRVDFSPDGRFLLTGSWDRSIIMRNVETGTIVRRFDGHTDRVRAVVFSPDGNHILSASCASEEKFEDSFICLQGELFLWHIESGEILFQSNDFGGNISLAYAPDGYSAMIGTCLDHTEEGVCTGGEIVQLNLYTDERLMDYVFTKRYVRELSCSERAIYGVEPSCVDDVPLPTVTAQATQTPPG